MSDTTRDTPFAGGGEMAALMQAYDWSATPLGPADAWPASLKSIVRVLLTSRFAMWMGWGPDLTFIYNDAYRRMTLGAKHPWALGRPFREVWAEVWPEIQPRIEQVIVGGEATWDEDLLLFLERSGFTEETYHTFSYSPLSDESGAIRGNLCVVTEETERVIGERRMALLRELAAAMTTSMTEEEICGASERVLADSPDLPFALTYVATEGGVDARLVCRTGIAADHPGALSSIDLHDGDAPWAVGPLGDHAQGRLVSLPAVTDEWPRGLWPRPATHALVLPIAQQGQKRAAGLFVAGLNPFRPLDDAYRSFVSLLAGQIAAGLANARAYEAERRRAQGLAEIDRAKTAFFNNISHEFRTPLTLLLGPLDEVRRDAEAPETVRERLDVAHRNGLRLLKLVNTLLEFSRIEAGRVRARFEPVDLGALTADLASTFESAMAHAGLTYRVDAPPQTVRSAFVDREMWEKIVLNLISNAFKFTLQGAVTVSLSADDHQTRLVVSDTGSGIPAAELPRIFDRFHRVEGVRGRSHEGSGIGLALVQELVRLHGGEIAADSEEGRGSRFTVTLPLGSDHLPAEHVVAAADAPISVAASSYADEAARWLPGSASAGRLDTSGERASEPHHDTGIVLLADDNADMREYARRLLSERWTVVAVRNGREALEIARRQRPDVIVTDVMMPELDGFGLIRAMRADSALQAIPVIMLSARAGEEARLEGLAASADDYLVKPFSARDLLARVEAQIVRAQLRAIEQRHTRRLAGLFAHAPVAIAVLTGPDLRFDLANDRYRALIGRRDVTGQPIREALPELADQGIFEILDRVRETGDPYVGHSRRVLLNRGAQDETEECFFDFVYQPVLDEDGSVNSVVVIAHDVTALSAAKREAENANRLKDEFLATLSHELRTPLNAVLGYTQMVRGGVIQPERLPAVLETIERNAKLQEQLISDVLDVSRIITGKLRLEVRPVDLTRVISEALETVTPAAMARGVRLQSMIDQPGVPVAGDAQRLQQVIWNLLSNAIKFTPRGGRVQIRLERVNSHVEITVSDTGDGIAPEFLPHLFQRFRQADSTFTRAQGGLGLGLAISRHLVEAHGGRIDAASPGKGQGTTIRVELPLMIVHDARHESTTRVHPTLDLPVTAPLHFADLRGLTVLLVDDDGDALEMAKEALTTAGAVVVTAANGMDALLALDQGRFDAAILDIGLPELDGYDLIRRIRARPPQEQRDLPAAALTAYARTVDRTRSLHAGFQIHLSKPVQPDELTAAVLALVGARRLPAD